MKMSHLYENLKWEHTDSMVTLQACHRVCDRKQIKGEATCVLYHSLSKSQFINCCFALNGWKGDFKW